MERPTELQTGFFCQCTESSKHLWVKHRTVCVYVQWQSDLKNAQWINDNSNGKFYAILHTNILTHTHTHTHPYYMASLYVYPQFKWQDLQLMNFLMANWIQWKTFAFAQLSRKTKKKKRGEAISRLRKRMPTEPKWCICNFKALSLFYLNKTGKY